MTQIDKLADVLAELVVAVEAKADIGKRREKTVSPRMEEALKAANDALNAIGRRIEPRNTRAAELAELRAKVTS